MMELYNLYKIIPVWPSEITYAKAASVLNISGTELCSLVGRLSSEAPICEDEKRLSYIDSKQRRLFLRKANEMRKRNELIKEKKKNGKQQQVQ